jgi:hypothetical protein
MMRFNRRNMLWVSLLILSVLAFVLIPYRPAGLGIALILLCGALYLILPYWQVLLGISLFILSAAIYFIHFFIFKDAHHIFIYLVGDIAFVPIEVLLVTLIIHSLLTHREKRLMLEKLNMVIGSFFTEVGTKLLRNFTALDRRRDELFEELSVATKWSDKEFALVANRLKDHPYEVTASAEALETLKDFLTEKMSFLLRLLENPNLLEHASFTDLLWAVFHVSEELGSRWNLRDLPESDILHLAGDIKRAYGRLVYEWVIYMRHLKRNYPYLFSHAVRTNPFDPAASPIVT